MIPKGLGYGCPHQRAKDDPTWYATARKRLGEDRPWYNWLNDQTHQETYTPMLWRCNPVNVANYAVAAAMLDAPLFLLGNEPENPKQSNTSPQDFADAVVMWRQQVPGMIALPGVYFDDAKWGKKWMQEYVRLGGPMPDVWAVHMYQPYQHQWDNSFPLMLDYLRSIKDLPVLLTECGGSYNDEECILSVMDCVKQAVRSGDVRAAYWFSAYYEADLPFNDLLTHDGKLTPIGKEFVKEQYTVYIPQVTKA